MIDIVVLTLKSTPQRTEFFRTRHSGRIKFTFHYGLDASQIPAADYWRVAAPDRKESKITNYSLMSPTELACTIGHHAILDNFVKSHHPADFLVVLEDDVILPEGTPLLLQEISKVAQDGIMVLGVDDIYAHEVLGRTIGKVANGQSLIFINTLHYRPWGTFFYMVSYSVAKRLLLSYEDYILMADDWVARVKILGTNRICLIKGISSPIDPSHSILHQDRADRQTDEDNKTIYT